MLTSKQEAALRAIVTEPTQTAAAKKAGVTCKTLYKWLAMPEFKMRLEEVYDTMLQDAARITIKNLKKAAEAQQKLLSSDKEEIRLRASDSIISNGLKLYDAAVVTKRLQKLEEKANRHD